MNMTLIPKTRSGKYALMSMIISIALVIGIMIVAANLEMGIVTGDFFGSLPLTLLTIAAFVGAVVAFLAGFFAVFELKDKSGLLYICLVISAVFIYYGIAQIIGALTETLLFNIGS